MSHTRPAAAVEIDVQVDQKSNKEPYLSLLGY